MQGKKLWFLSDNINGRTWLMPITFRTKTLKTLATILAFSFIMLTLSQSAIAVNQNLDSVAKVSFTFDDGLASASTEAAKTLANYGFTGTDYVITSCVGMNTVPNNCPADGDVPYMTWSQIIDLQNKGWEIGSHTNTHPLLASTDPDIQPVKLTLDEVKDELTISKNALEAQGISAKAFSSSYGDWDQTVLAEIAKVYTSHRGYADTGYNPFPYNDYLLRDQQVQAGVSVDTVKGYIDYAIANNQWLILTFHDIKTDASTDPDDYQYETKDLDAIAAYVKAKNVPVVNITEGLASSNVDLFANETFDTPIASTLTDAAVDTTVWSTDSPDLIKVDSDNNGSTPNPANSALLSSISSNTTETHLFSPIVKIDPTQAYVIKSYLNVLGISAGSVGFYIDEYDGTGTWLTGGFRVKEINVFLENINFQYVPTSALVDKIRLQVVLSANANITAYVDNIQFLSPVDLFNTLTPGDANGDGNVDALDLSILASNWLGTGKTFAQGDFSFDGTVNALDLSILATNWGKKS
jgi:peptidoglycan/xylan/chitin deacetylase (PgdA/CDA1 family)